LEVSFSLPQASVDQKQNGSGTNTVESVRMLISQKICIITKVTHQKHHTRILVIYLLIYLAHLIEYLIRSLLTQARFLYSGETTRYSIVTLFR